MAFQPVPNGIQAELRGTLRDKPVEMVLHIEASGTIGVDECAEVANIIDDWCTEQYFGFMTAEYIYRQTYVKSLVTEIAPEYTSTENAGEPGVAVGTAVPNNVSFVTKKLSGLTGRSSRGRTYWMGFPTSFVTGNFISPVLADGYLSGLGILKEALGTSEYVLSILSRVQDGAPLANGLLYPILTFAYSGLRVDTRRKRLPAE